MNKNKCKLELIKRNDLKYRNYEFDIERVKNYSFVDQSQNCNSDESFAE